MADWCISEEDEEEGKEEEERRTGGRSGFEENHTPPTLTIWGNIKDLFFQKSSTMTNMTSDTLYEIINIVEST